jgi:hypothetical protein
MTFNMDTLKIQSAALTRKKGLIFKIVHVRNDDKSNEYFISACPSTEHSCNRGMSYAAILR